MPAPRGATAWFTEAGPGRDPLRANLGLHVGDDPALVHRRRRDLADACSRALVWMDQTHSTRVLTLRRAGGRVLVTDEGGSPVDAGPLGETTSGEWGPLACDGIVVDARGWPDAPGVAVMVADCVPVLLGDATGEVLAAVHAGRKGLGGGILTHAVAAMRRCVGESVRLRATIGPCVCGACYEVPEAMRADLAATHPSAWSLTRWGTPALDLAAGAAEELGSLGVDVDRVHRCTREDPMLHSHRRDPHSGRQAGIIVPAAVGDMPGDIGDGAPALH